MSQGLTCPKCGCADLRVWQVRNRGESRHRVKICRNCNQRIATIEKVTGKASAAVKKQKTDIHPK